jgi:hypothetical protein
MVKKEEELMMLRRLHPFFIVAILIGYTMMFSTFSSESFAFLANVTSEEGTEGRDDVYNAYIEQILSEGTKLSSQRKRLDEETIKNDLLEKQVKKEDTDIKAQSIYEKKNVELFKNFNENVNKTTREYNNYCKGKHAGGEYEKRKVWCDKNEKQIQDDQKKLNQIGTAIAQRLTELENRKKKLSEDTLTQFSQKKELNAKWEDWDVNQKDWLSRYRQLIMTPVFKDMERRAKLSVDCTNMATLEDARQCLQGIWDHAQQKTEVQK